jgi:1-acyl-sn-glycerol-3-phosphate acyltransferase
MPPAAVRRPLTITAWLLMSVLALALSPLVYLLAAAASALMRKPQPLLLARIVTGYFAIELATLVACGALWLASGFGVQMRSPRFQKLHHRLLRWFVHRIALRAFAVLDINVATELADGAAQALERDRPLLFFSRHAGPGDTILLIDMLASQYDRLPSVVFKETIAIDPCVDLIAHRLPHAILDTSEPERCEARIQQVSSELGPRGVLVLFPEGGNFTSERRRTALRKLRRKGMRDQAAAGEQMRNVLPPHPAGVRAALRGNPDAGVLVGAHSGLGLAAFPSDWWRDPPIGRTLTEHIWLEPASERPQDPEQQERWLYDWWKRIDEWVEQRGEGGPQPADSTSA